MKIQNFIAVLIVTTFTLACGAKYAKVKIKDANAGSKHVYGDIGGPSKHLKNSYPGPTPETVEKATKFRKLIESELVSAR